MNLPLYQVDAFTDRVFAGNPAAVVVLESWPDDRLLQAIAAENNLSETAFLVRAAHPGDHDWSIRWFTPRVEVDLCGHATLASAWVIFHLLGWAETAVRFASRRRGILRVERTDGDRLTLDFPALPPRPCNAPAGLAEALGAAPRETHDSDEDLLAVFADQDAVAGLRPDFRALAAVDCRGVICTAPGEACDFVSRFFGPQVGIDEDPVTGSAHCVLVPYWSRRLGRARLHARQISARGGELRCEDRDGRVRIAGRAALYLEGRITV